MRYCAKRGIVTIFRKENTTNIPIPDKLPSASVLTDMVITSDQVKKKLDKLKENSAPGPDGITPRMLKLNATSLAPVLCSRSFHYRDRKTFIQLYKQYVQPHLEFSIPAWSPWTLADKDMLEKVQRRAVRMVSGLTGSTYEERLQELGLLSLEDRRRQYDLVQTFKIVRGFDDVSASTWFNLMGDNPTRVTRNTVDPLNIVRKNPRTEIRRNFFSHRVIDSWNSIPSELKNVSSIFTFKK